MLRVSVALVLLLATGCSSSRGVRLETGQGRAWEYAPPTWDRSVEVDHHAFEEALSQLVLAEPFSLRPAHPAELVRTSFWSSSEPARWQDLAYKGLGGLCQPGQPKAHCLSVLDDVLRWSELEKLAMALGLSFDPLRDSIAHAVQDTLAPELFYSVIATGLVSWVILAANPEPVFTKAAAIVSAVMLIYLGVDTFLAVLQASLELKRASAEASTFEELRDASHRFARALGPPVARVFVLAVTLAVTHGMTGGAAWLASRMATLPSYPEAAALGAAQVGLSLANVGQVSAIAVVEGKLVISLAPTAVAMAAANPPSGSAPTQGLRVSGDELAKLRRDFEGVKARFWKNEAEVNAGAYSAENLARMKNGKPPIGPDGHPMELHHKVPLAEGGSNAFENLAIKTRTEHRLGPNYKQNHPNLP